MKKHSFIARKKYSFFAVAAFSFVMGVTALSWTPAETPASKTTSVAVSSKNEKATGSAQELFSQYVTEVYQAAGLSKAGLSENVFKKAVVGYYNLKRNNQLAKSLITIVDFTKSSTQKRLWIVDLENKKILFNTLVAHGQGSGDDLPTKFSNTNESHQSSLGFYVTEQTYQGKHGLSLKLNGVDAGYNDKALERAVVMHAADYVSEDFIKTHGRLGRSFGCPALPPAVTRSIIDTVKGKSLLFINGPESSYKSNYLDQDIAAQDFAANATESIKATI